LADDIDRASEREEEALAQALREQARRAGLAGKTLADSAEVCQQAGCDEPIPLVRRQALPGCQLCVDCQARRERTKGRR